MPSEANFANWLKRRTDKAKNILWQRIETITASGVPDVFAQKFLDYAWIELKALPASNVRIRNTHTLFCIFTSLIDSSD